MATTSFRKPFTVMRASSGAYNTSGAFVPSAETALQISATIQPATINDYDILQAELGGERYKRMIRVYTDAFLVVADPRADSTGYEPVADIIVYPLSPDSGAGRYRVTQVAAWQSGVISHYRYIAVDTLEGEAPTASGGIPLPPPVVSTPQSSGGVTSTLIASAPISGQSVLMFDGVGGVVTANPTSPSYQFAGLSTAATQAGQPVPILETGIMTEAGWNWQEGTVLYAGPSGTLTQTVPTTGVLQQIAVALSATSIFVAPQLPFTRN